MSHPDGDTPPTPDTDRTRFTNRRLWAWSVMVSAISAVANAVMSDSWGWRTMFLTCLGFVAGTLVCRGVMALYVRAKPETR
jgi:hypothetical protein